MAEQLKSYSLNMHIIYIVKIIKVKNRISKLIEHDKYIVIIIMKKFNYLQSCQFFNNN